MGKHATLETDARRMKEELAKLEGRLMAYNASGDIAGIAATEKRIEQVLAEDTGGNLQRIIDVVEQRSSQGDLQALEYSRREAESAFDVQGGYDTNRWINDLLGTSMGEAGGNPDQMMLQEENSYLTTPSLAGIEAGPLPVTTGSPLAPGMGNLLPPEAVEPEPAPVDPRATAINQGVKDAGAWVLNALGEGGGNLAEQLLRFNKGVIDVGSAGASVVSPELGTAGYGLGDEFGAGADVIRDGRGTPVSLPPIDTNPNPANEPDQDTTPPLATVPMTPAAQGISMPPFQMPSGTPSGGLTPGAGGVSLPGSVPSGVMPGSLPFGMGEQLDAAGAPTNVDQEEVRKANEQLGSSDTTRGGGAMTTGGGGGGTGGAAPAGAASAAAGGDEAAPERFEGFMSGGQNKLMDFLGKDKEGMERLGLSLMGFGSGVLTGGPDLGAAIGSGFDKAASQYVSTKKNQMDAGLNEQRMARLDEELDMKRERFNLDRAKAARDRTLELPADMVRLQRDAKLAAEGYGYDDDGKPTYTKPVPSVSKDTKAIEADTTYYMTDRFRDPATGALKTWDQAREMALTNKGRRLPDPALGY